MRFLRPSWGVILLPFLLALFGFLPVLLLRYTMYALLAVPLWPLIERFGWVYRDKPMFITPAAAAFSGCIWAVALYVFLCFVRFVSARQETLNARSA